MIAPRWFQHEVKLIDQDYFVFFNEKKCRWEIRLWKKHFGRWTQDKENIANNSLLVMTCCEYDENLNDIGFRPLDQRLLYALKKAKRNAENPLVVLREIDEANKKLEEEFDEAAEDAAREVVKSAWTIHHRHIFDIGKK